jgi:hypothetical protein
MLFVLGKFKIIFKEGFKMNTIDEYLGSFNSRYFGAGHKETTYHLKKEIKDKDEYVFSMKQKGIWSEKNGVEQTAHLSTIDGIILGNMAAEIFLHNELMISSEQLYLAKFDIKAGSSPIENLNAVSVACTKSQINDKIIELHYRISGMKIILTYKNINETAITRIPRSPLYTFAAEADFLSNHLRFLKHEITNIDSIGVKGIICDVQRKGKVPSGMQGANSGIKEIPSLIEWLVIFSQMAQVAAYNFDCMEREDSHTLWMKHVQAEIKELNFDTGERSVAWGEINAAKLIQMKGNTWRTFSMFGEAADHNVDFIGKIAHQLPASKGVREEQKYAK